MALLLLIVLTLIPIVVGSVFFKIYRHIKPFKVDNLQGLASVGTHPKDGFFKVLIVGWLLCSPVYYVLCAHYW